MTPKLCIAVHDVAPETWPQCVRLFAMLDALGAPPLTLLVVPDWHGRGRIDRAPGFLREMEKRIERGDEIALHGYFHRDDAPKPRTPTAWFYRRMLTASEGEFADLPSDVAELRMRRGLELFAGLGWKVNGFVPPAWLASAGTRLALRRSGVRWTSTHTRLISFGHPQNCGERHILAPCLTASSRSAWRRVASRAWLHAALLGTQRAELLRVGLHPVDAEHVDPLECWREILTVLLNQRAALTKSEAVSSIVEDCEDQTTMALGRRTFR